MRQVGFPEVLRQASTSIDEFESYTNGWEMADTDLFNRGVILYFSGQYYGCNVEIEVGQNSCSWLAIALYDYLDESTETEELFNIQFTFLNPVLEDGVYSPSIVAVIGGDIEVANNYPPLHRFINHLDGQLDQVLTYALEQPPDGGDDSIRASIIQLTDRIRLAVT